MPEQTKRDAKLVQYLNEAYAATERRLQAALAAHLGNEPEPTPRAPSSSTSRRPRRTPPRSSAASGNSAARPSWCPGPTRWAEEPRWHRAR